MNILEGVRRLNQELQEQNGKLFGADGVEISLHHLCAPDHQEIQGRQFSNEEWERINSSLKRPIGTLNCGHHVSPIILAAAKPVYTAQERAEAISRSNETVEYNGRKMTRYEASQRMRAKERKIRNMRSEEKALRAAGDTSGASAVKRDIRRRTAEYKKFCGDVGLEERMDRTYYFTTGNRKKTVDFSGGSGIIEAENKNMVLESQRYGRNKSTLINKTYIDSGEYKRKFDNATDNPEVNKSLYNCAKTALKHRSGTVYEDMYWIDGDTGKIVAEEINGSIERTVKYSASTKKTVNSYKKKKLVTLHTHPSSMPPSAADFNACCNHGYQCGYIACHDGKIFGYVADETVNERLYNLYIKSYVNEGYTEYEAQIAALNELKRNYKIDFWEVS